MRKHLLHRDWWLSLINPGGDVPQALKPQLVEGVPATVPGCVHTDLMAAGLLEDPYLGDNELRQLWIGHCDWRYTCRFTLDHATCRAERIDLVCDGLDTIAAVAINGEVIGESHNMHVARRFGLKGFVGPGEHELSITFTGPMTYAATQESVYHGLPRAGGAQSKVNPHNLLRKMSCNMGWDWGPEVPTCGIWRPIRIEAWDTARIAHVRPLVTRADAEKAVVRVVVDAETATGGPPPAPEAHLLTPAGERLEPARTEGGTLVFEVDRPRLWWPVGHGEQPLYTLHATLGDDAWSRRIGLRTSRLVTDPDPAPFGDPVPDKAGETMTLLVNGKPVYCKGANWIPDDCFLHRVTPERYRQRITQARDANMNMLRVWGGGIYEEEAFYDVCDELGVMVWQDFLFACACYPEEEPYRSLVEEEARYNVARLANHASLVIWNGCNENIWAAFDWGEKWVKIRTEGTCTWGLGYYLDLLPRIVRELDPTKPYWPGSPYSGSMDRHPNANEYGNRHMWDVWHGPGQYRNYLAHYPRMATEFGYHGPPAYATLARAIPESERWWDSPLMRLHNKNGRPGQQQTTTRMADDFVPPANDPAGYDDWHYLAQIMQARALAMGCEWFRALFPWNSAALYWQLNDCWPVSSWSAIDGDGRLKPLWYASRRFFADRLVTIKPRRVTPGGERIGPLAVYLHNDHGAPWAGECLLQRWTLDGRVAGETRQPVSVAPRSLARFDVPASLDVGGDDDDAAESFLVATVGTEAEHGPGRRGFWWFAPDKVMPYAEPRFDASLRPAGAAPGEHVLTITAETVLRDLCVFVDRLDPDATVSDAFVTLLPGERVDLRVRSARPLTVEDLTRPPVLNVANRFGRVAAAV